ncbi:hypothetical protein OF364_01135 [Mycoplasma enhydrae]|uniref:hypothetical protein n=1 Tax=Mycoplasma enhydrae TaxID=2499220 RepID=UPI00197C5B0A|nr:hypothetical protein [Mycoplasma enhydrae]MBN4089237.1 hypothetical protein [Mycoplasma enhydrae]MCV3733603.1 hypothetical protein [Mycoplasma enhydrae]MCV3753420.1 hypothetical protein [Mycoplasma enhydrae]
MAKLLGAQKQKDTRSLKYDPENDSISKIIAEFQNYKKKAYFYKPYSEMEIFSFFQKIRFMKIMDEKNSTKIEETQKRQNKIKLKYANYIEYEKWSDSPLATKTKPMPLWLKITIISAFIALIIIMLVIILGLNKWW